MAGKQTAIEVQAAVTPLILSLRVRDELGAAEEQALREAVGNVRELVPGHVLIRNGHKPTESTLLISGIMCRYKELSNGDRQIQELHVAGDFVDLHGFLLKRLDHNVAAVSRCEIALVPHARLKKITEDYPHLSRLLWFATLLDAAIQREAILSVGRRTALARIAHMMCELSTRLSVVGLSDNASFALPMTQTDLADAAGLTAVHVNRMLKQLRDQKILTFRQGVVTIHDWPSLVRIAEFDPTYLHLERQPR